MGKYLKVDSDYLIYFSHYKKLPEHYLKLLMYKDLLVSLIERLMDIVIRFLTNKNLNLLISTLYTNGW